MSVAILKYASAVYRLFISVSNVRSWREEERRGDDDGARPEIPFGGAFEAYILTSTHSNGTKGCLSAFTLVRPG